VTGALRACAAIFLVLQVTADTAAALPHQDDLPFAASTLESHHSAQCVRLHDAALCALCQYHAARPLTASQRRLPLATEVGLRIGDRGRPHAPRPQSRDRSSPPRAPPTLRSR